MKPYSIDLRQRIIDAVDEKEGSLREIAETYKVSKFFIDKLIRQRKETGTIEPLPHGGGQSPLLDEGAEKLIREYIKENADATLAELCQFIEKKKGISASQPTMCRVLQKLDLPRKKNIISRRG